MHRPVPGMEGGINPGAARLFSSQRNSPACSSQPGLPSSPYSPYIPSSTGPMTPSVGRTMPLLTLSSSAMSGGTLQSPGYYPASPN
ncbi:hypothetical protein DPMN_132125 [Dreissena polymorpha]|uniref:Uncharacterized protein n=1 Tax=Dreissena polymorpha TaxID=45954 RepID=A0A9D4J9T4_DREPO|nr:hypothetical protein DPMN_132125 [Dreissena polymorpha]